VAEAGTKRRKTLWVLVGLALMLPVLAAGLLLVGRYAEDVTLARAAGQLSEGRSEAALHTLAPLKTQRLLSREARRRAAELYFRLGEDKTAHTLLRGVPFREGDPDDKRLRELSARCQTAASLMKRADSGRSPAERVRLVRAAQDELPDAPGVLKRVAEAELQAFIQAKPPASSRSFEEAYAELRDRAPSLAAEVKRQAEQALAREER
jgi:hypothetical protein